MGLINPVTVRRAGARFELIAGKHRLEAFKCLNRTHIPAIICEADDQTTSTLRLAENLTRSQLSPIEEAVQLAQLVDTHPQGVDGVAAQTGRKVPWILDRLDMLAWPDDLQAAVHLGKIPVSAAKILVRIPNPETRTARIRDALNHGINARTAALWLQNALAVECTDSNASETATCGAISQTPSEVWLSCFACGEPQRLGTVVTTRLCQNCATALHNAVSIKTPIQSPPHLPPAKPAT